MGLEGYTRELLCRNYIMLLNLKIDLYDTPSCIHHASEALLIVEVKHGEHVVVASRRCFDQLPSSCKLE